MAMPSLPLWRTMTTMTAGPVAASTPCRASRCRRPNHHRRIPYRRPHRRHHRHYYYYRPLPCEETTTTTTTRRPSALASPSSCRRAAPTHRRGHRGRCHDRDGYRRHGRRYCARTAAYCATHDAAGAHARTRINARRRGGRSWRWWWWWSSRRRRPNSAIMIRVITAATSMSTTTTRRRSSSSSVGSGYAVAIRRQFVYTHTYICVCMPSATRTPRLDE